jgi:hypothetical protein
MGNNKKPAVLHPDAQIACGFWLDLTQERCGKCERCRAEPSREVAGRCRFPTPMSWQPISTAPSGVAVLVRVSEDGPPYVALKGERHGRWHSIPGSYQIRPLGWMPLPDPLVTRATEGS